MSSDDYNISKKLPDIANQILDQLEKITNKELTFCLFVFNSEDKRAHYITNAEREDVMYSIKEYIEQLEQKQPHIPDHLKN